jgi:hypothetical protein
MPRRTGPLALALALAACGGGEPGSGGSAEAPLAATHEPGDEPGSTRASREEARAASAPIAATRPEVIVPASSPTPLLSIARSDAERGEDGRGAIVPAARPVAFDLDARRFPPRAMDPVLHVGELRFVHYEHPRPGVLRFVAADAAALPEGAEVAVQYGSYADTRTVVAAALALPVELRP